MFESGPYASVHLQGFQHAIHIKNHCYETVFSNMCSSYLLHQHHLGCWCQPNILNQNLVVSSDITKMME